MRRAALGLGALALLAGAAGLWITRAEGLGGSAKAAIAAAPADAALGEQVFWAAGCASCHAAEDAEGEARLVLEGGQRFASDFGTFVAPNVSTDPVHGIGAWTPEQFADAVQRGVSPEGAHYYPAFPYTAYALMEPPEVAALWAFWQTLPASDAASQPHEVGFPFSIRRGVGAWKMLYAGRGYVVEEESRGRHLVEAMGHCGECHTSRDPIGGLRRSAWLQGAPNPDGEGRVPAIAGLDWSEAEIASYLADGFTPEFDVAAGSMASVVKNLSHLPDEDRLAIARYVKAVPAAVE
ncbi:cytochrome c [Jannaschia sp. W003]|uniref:c-type cytochrome n=1 Tax=Jannaschia sp. W003 TaxID=2867012 RepID=UPI0021A40D87|nr:cytochrome c [Jannaschia sp. W003]UWQ20306.1 cytochrome c [Jannaschia sp. W003]